MGTVIAKRWASIRRRREWARLDAEIVEYKGNFYLAKWSDTHAQFSGALRPEIAAGGCSSFYCRTESQLPAAGGYVYRSRASARRAVRRWCEFVLENQF